MVHTYIGKTERRDFPIIIIKTKKFNYSYAQWEGRNDGFCLINWPQACWRTKILSTRWSDVSPFEDNIEMVIEMSSNICATA